MAAPPPLAQQQAIVRRVFGPGWTYQRGFSLHYDPISGLPGHYGWDVSAKEGMPVPALTGGKVVFAGNAGSDVHASKYGGLGNAVVTEQGGARAVYGHLSRIDVRKGQTIDAGTDVGAVGKTGLATGPHLHVGAIDTDDTYQDPRALIETGSLSSYEGKGDVGSRPGNTGGPLTFWGVVTYPRGHVLTDADVDDIMKKLVDAGYFKDDITGLSQVALRSLLTAMVGRRWDDTLAVDIQRGLGMGAGQLTAPGGPFDPLGVGPLVGFLGKLSDPGNWALFLLVIAGGAMVLVGGWKVLGGAGKQTVSRPAARPRPTVVRRAA